MVMLGRCCSCINWGKDAMKRFVAKFIPFEIIWTSHGLSRENGHQD